MGDKIIKNVIDYIISFPSLDEDKTSFPYFGVKLSCVFLMIAYRKKLPKVTQR